jgi:hypothetical protein
MTESLSQLSTRIDHTTFHKVEQYLDELYYPLPYRKQYTQQRQQQISQQLKTKECLFFLYDIVDGFGDYQNGIYIVKELIKYYKCVHIFFHLLRESIDMCLSYELMTLIIEDIQSLQGVPGFRLNQQQRTNIRNIKMTIERLETMFYDFQTNYLSSEKIYDLHSFLSQPYIQFIIDNFEYLLYIYKYSEYDNDQYNTLILFIIKCIYLKRFLKRVIEMGVDVVCRFYIIIEMENWFIENLSTFLNDLFKDINPDRFTYNVPNNIRLSIKQPYIDIYEFGSKTNYPYRIGFYPHCIGIPRIVRIPQTIPQTSSEVYSLIYTNQMMLSQLLNHLKSMLLSIEQSKTPRIYSIDNHTIYKFLLQILSILYLLHISMLINNIENMVIYCSKEFIRILMMLDIIIKRRRPRKPMILLFNNKDKTEALYFILFVMMITIDKISDEIVEINIMDRPTRRKTTKIQFKQLRHLSHSDFLKLMYNSDNRLPLILSGDQTLFEGMSMRKKMLYSNYIETKISLMDNMLFDIYKIISGVSEQPQTLDKQQELERLKSVFTFSQNMITNNFLIPVLFRFEYTQLIPLLQSYFECQSLLQNYLFHPDRVRRMDFTENLKTLIFNLNRVS